MRRPVRLGIVTRSLSVNPHLPGRQQANLFDLCLPKVVTVLDHHLFDAQLGERNLAAGHLRLPADHLAGIQHSDIGPRAGGLFVGFRPDMLCVHPRIIHQRMGQTVLHRQTEERLRPDIEATTFKVNIFYELAQRIRDVLAQLDRLREYAPNVLVNGLFVGRKKRGHSQALFVILSIFFRPARQISLSQLAHVQRAAHQSVVNVPRLHHVPIVQIGC